MRRFARALATGGASLFRNSVLRKPRRSRRAISNGAFEIKKRTFAVEDAVKKYTMYLIVPGWILSSFIDYLLHRRENIQTTSGVAESAIHSLMLAEGAVPTLAGLFLDVNAGVLATMVAGFIVHQGTAMWDVFLTAKRRRIGPAEQHIHSALEMLPFCGLSLTACLHPDQFLSLLHLNDLSPDWDLRLKRDPLPANYVALMLGATGAVAALYAEELWRCLNAARRHLTGVNTPCATTELFGSNERSSRSNERSSNCTSSETTLQRRDETE